MADRVRPAVVSIVAAMVVTLAAAGCGVSTSEPVDIGDKLAPAVEYNDSVMSAPRPNDATSPEDLVLSYLKAAVGGGESSINQVKAFLIAKARDEWTTPPDPKSITVIRLVEPPVAGPLQGPRTPVRVRYQIVGLLNDQGRVDEPNGAIGEMTFWVAVSEENSTKLRIDQIENAPASLMLTDDALVDLYRPQPVYFWDKDNKYLVPDLRYLALTQSRVQRAQQVLDWLVDGPSSWLPGAQRLPAGTTSQPLVNTDDTFVINLSPQAGAGGTEAVHRLYYQLQWSMGAPSGQRIQLKIDDKAQQIPADKYRQYNLSDSIDPVVQRYDIVGEKVVLVGGDKPAILDTPANTNVVFAAVSRGRTPSYAAFVRRGNDGKRSLQIVRDGGKVDARVVLKSASMGRPVWIPGTDGQLLIPSDGRLYAVSAGDGKIKNVTPPLVGNVTALAVAADGRRVALIANGQTYVASLSVSQNAVTIGSNPRPILAGQMTARAVAWLNETWLYVGGSAGGAPAMWRVTADSVVAENESVSLKGLTPTDVVAYWSGPSTRLNEVIVYTSQGAYIFGTSLTPAPQYKSPFFAS